MKFLDLLAKLGILRKGAKVATYRSATERPAEFMMKGVFDAERDLLTRKKKPAARTPEKGGEQS